MKIIIATTVNLTVINYDYNYIKRNHDCNHDYMYMILFCTVSPSMHLFDLKLLILITETSF